MNKGCFRLFVIIRRKRYHAQYANNIDRVPVNKGCFRLFVIIRRKRYQEQYANNVF